MGIYCESNLATNEFENLLTFEVILLARVTISKIKNYFKYSEKHLHQYLFRHCIFSWSHKIRVLSLMDFILYWFASLIEVIFCARKCDLRFFWFTAIFESSCKYKKN